MECKLSLIWSLHLLHPGELQVTKTARYLRLQTSRTCYLTSASRSRARAEYCYTPAILQFAIKTSKASRPRRTPGTALSVRKAARVQAVTCLAQLALPHQAGNTQGGAATALDLNSPAVTGLPSAQPPSTNKCENISLSKKNCECHWRSGKTPVWL